MEDASKVCFAGKNGKIVAIVPAQRGVILTAEKEVQYIDRHRYLARRQRRRADVNEN